MLSVAGAGVAAFGGCAGHGWLGVAAFLAASRLSSNANANIGARNLSVIRVTQTYTFLTSR